MIATIPKDRLLIHEAKDGYGPICDFLGLPMPEEPYPRLNDTKEQQERGRRGRQISYAIIFGTPVIFGTASYFVLKYLGILKH